MDLDNLFKTTSSSKDKKNNTIDLVVSDDLAFLQAIDELYAIEGFSSPLKVDDIDDESWHKTNAEIKHVILDLRACGELISEVAEISSRLDVSISLIVVSNMDSILMRDKVLSLGANYILWDPELDGLLGALKESSAATFSPTVKKKSRIAKRVLMLGSKGGVGVSTISAFLSHSLSQQANLKTLLVEHDTIALNSDIFLGLKGLKAQQNSIDLNQSELDAAIAGSYVKPVKDRLNFLTLEKNVACLSDHVDSLFRISNELVDQYNFIIDSMPLSAIDELTAEDISDRYNRIFIVCEPSVASLRAYHSIKKKLGKSEHRVIFSMTRSQKDYMMPLQGAKEKIKAKDAIDFAYEANLEKLIIQQGIQNTAKLKFAPAIANIVNLLTGKKVKVQKKFAWFKK
ncbi:MULTISPECIES: AAA family ATPase [Vibrio]|uniref:Type II secretion protein n=1 Tax=Vibrio harveyi TaxID=669 RepID=A0A8B3DB18_VIBHA|nr:MULTISPECIES: AAA family ATPase [Vibrio]EKO3815375.1 AAA family ATPase [Vibrio harveyi]EKO3838951.1 AAA family ATPase [Vibrio harveyi]EKO3847457.1 AAA family ATPase [Vibrio harveyi]EKO3858729.1 AAA family ATPase [Vibrio harveyi]ELC3159980.1 AAA family ATPase [Vibrio harveyi]